jgi:hypothetical protein
MGNTSKLSKQQQSQALFLSQSKKQKSQEFAWPRKQHLETNPHGSTTKQ